MKRSVLPRGNSRAHQKSNILANVLAVVVIMHRKLGNISVLNAASAEVLAIFPESVVPKH